MRRNVATTPTPALAHGEADDLPLRLPRDLPESPTHDRAAVRALRAAQDELYVVAPEVPRRAEPQRFGPMSNSNERQLRTLSQCSTRHLHLVMPCSSGSSSGGCGLAGAPSDGGLSATPADVQSGRRLSLVSGRSWGRPGWCHGRRWAGRVRGRACRVAARGIGRRRGRRGRRIGWRPLARRARDR